MEKPKDQIPLPGSLLISEPFLRDPNFTRTVVCICAHNEEGTVGFVLNRPYKQRLGELIPALERHDIPVYYGGPVEQQTLHMVHGIQDLAFENTEIANGIYWGADFELIIDLINADSLDLNRIRFFMGYSGWSAGQLDKELEEKSWLVTAGSQELIFDTEPGEVWGSAILTLDKHYHPLVHYPTDPQLN